MPVLYGTHTQCLIYVDAIESVQKRAARWICARWDHLHFHGIKLMLTVYASLIDLLLPTAAIITLLIIFIVCSTKGLRFYLIIILN